MSKTFKKNEARKWEGKQIYSDERESKDVRRVKIATSNRKRNSDLNDRGE
jgi:hypothetical protein